MSSTGIGYARQFVASAKIRSLAISTLTNGIGFRLNTVGATSIPRGWCGDSSRNAVSLIQVNIASAERSLRSRWDLFGAV
jgi:hypothetical protein